jgi:capsular polysaccharide biosynthesis protein
MKKMFAQHFPNHDIDIYTDADTKLMQNPGEQVTKFHRADIVIGIHGAGLTNALYMKPGSVLIEALPYFDSRHVPLVGIFARLANIVGLHHYSYFFGEEKIDGGHLVDEVVKFSRQVAPHIQ